MSFHHSSYHVGSLLRILLLTAVVTLLSAPFTARAQQNPVPDRLEEAYIQVRVGDIAEKLLTMYVAMPDTLFMPLGETLEFFGCRIERLESYDDLRITLALNNQVTLSLSQRKVIFPDRDVPIQPEWIVPIGDELYVRDTLLAICVKTSVRFDVAALVARVGEGPLLPVVDQHNMRAGWAKRAPTENTTGYSYEAVVGREAFGLPNITWAASSSYSRRIGTQSSYSSGGTMIASMPFLYGTLSAGSQGAIGVSANGRSASGSFGNFNWLLPIDGSEWISRVSLSDVNLRGVTLGLSNPQTGVRYVTRTVSGSTHPGWIVELYRSGALYNVTTADSTSGDYEFTVVMSGYGAEDCFTVAVGPYGEREVQTHNLGSNNIGTSPGTITYDAQFMIPRFTDSLPMNSSIAVDMTMFDWLAVGGRVSHFTPTIKVYSNPTTKWWNDIFAAYTARVWYGGATSSQFGYQQKTNMLDASLQTQIASIPLSFGATGIHASDSATFDMMTLFASTGAYVSSGEVSTGLYASALHFNRVLTISGGIFATASLLSLSAETRYAAQGDWGYGMAPADGKLPATPNLGFLDSRVTLTSMVSRGVSLQGSASYDHLRQGMKEVTLSSRIRVIEDLSISASLVIPRGEMSNAIVRVGLGGDFDWMNWTSTLAGTQNGQTAAASASGVVSLAGGVLATGTKGLVSQCRVRLLAFHDRNGNGRQDEGEEDLDPPVATIAGIARNAEAITSDENGFLTQIPPNTDLLLEVDRWIKADKDFFPSQRSFAVNLPAGAMATINVPYQKGYTVSGRCWIERTGTDGKKVLSTQGIAALRIWLRQVGGVGLFEGEMFEDGSLMIIGVPVGEYTVQFDKAQLSYRRLTPKQPDMILSIDESTTELPDITLVRDSGKGTATPTPDTTE